MKKFILAAVAALSLGIGSAYAAQTAQHQSNPVSDYSFGVGTGG